MTTFLNKRGAIKMRFLPLIFAIPAIGGIFYGAALTTGPAIGLFFLCFVIGINFVGIAMNYDEIKKLQEDNERIREAIRSMTVGHDALSGND
jgi:hypothetical protein